MALAQAVKREWKSIESKCSAWEILILSYHLEEEEGEGNTFLRDIDFDWEALRGGWEAVQMRGLKRKKKTK